MTISMIALVMAGVALMASLMNMTRIQKMEAQAEALNKKAEQLELKAMDLEQLTKQLISQATNEHNMNQEAHAGIIQEVGKRLETFGAAHNSLVDQLDITNTQLTKVNDYLDKRISALEQKEAGQPAPEAGQEESDALQEWMDRVDEQERKLEAQDAVIDDQPDPDPDEPEMVTPPADPIAYESADPDDEEAGGEA